MQSIPIPESIRNAPQPIRADLLLPRLDEIITRAEVARNLCRDRLPDGICITPTAAGAIGLMLDGIRTELDAMCEAMRLKIVTLDCVTAIAAVLGRGGMSESALYQRLIKRGFPAADQKAALRAMIEGGKLIRLATPTGKPGPIPNRIYWRETKETDA